jgi:REP-associated tyrosine transposase
MVIRKRLKIKGQALVFITTTVNNRSPVFHDDRYSEIVMSQLKETLIHFDVSIIGFVLMPSHLHMLLGFKEIELLSKFMQSFKILSSKKIKSVLFHDTIKRLSVNGKFQFWAHRFDDLIIVSEHQFKIKLNYIHNNPVKAGLVGNVTDWNYSSASDWLTDVGGKIKIDKDFEWTD